MNFRKDINGLRAIAVIAVVLYHFNAGWMPGGFAGVDVFFVISGFLMTGIIWKGLEQDDFSIFKFYTARANRIIPALAFLCVVILIFGWFYIPPSDYKILSKHVASSIAFFSNYIYATESGYFATASHEKWLLHTWSLSVEWQFYLIYPLFLLALKRIASLQHVKVFVVVTTILSFLMCILITDKWASYAFYILPTRVWEMTLGGIAYLYPLTINDNRKKNLEWLGITLILISYFTFSKNDVWPGHLALIPAFGAYFIIQAHQNNSIVTGNRIFQYIGKCSYSIYLWHWPLAVALVYFSLDNYWLYLAVLGTVIFGGGSQKYIESLKFIKTTYRTTRNLNILTVSTVSLVVVASFTLYSNNAFEWHYSESVLVADQERNNRNPYQCMAKHKFPCYIGNKKNIKAIVVGDSHADAMATSVSSLFRLEEDGIIVLTKESCPFILQIKSFRHGTACLEENVERLRFLRESLKNVPIIWVARTGAYLYGQSNPNRIIDDYSTKPSIYFSEPQESANKRIHEELSEHLEKTINSLAGVGPLYIVLPVPEMRRNVPKQLSRLRLLSNDYYDFSISDKLYFERNDKIRKILIDTAIKTGSKVLDPYPILCPNNRCIATHNERPIYYDGDHLSEYGNKLLSPMFSEVFISRD